jgi:hypothetical protein
LSGWRCSAYARPAVTTLYKNLAVIDVYVNIAAAAYIAYLNKVLCSFS